MIFSKLNKEKKLLIKEANELYSIIVQQARKKEFYSKLGVPDTVDGRFENIILHLYFINKRLLNGSEKDKKIMLNIIDLMFKDFDYNLRELGVGDLSVGKKIYHMTGAYRGRFKAYDKAIEIGRKELLETLKRNLYGTVQVNIKNLNIMTDYFLETLKNIKNLDYNKIKKTKECFFEINI